ncbi:MAG: segregation and condensation protein A [Oscillospiraceae bacterium]
MEKAIQFHLEDFNGPLDLLLALISKNKMSIYDIEILTIIDQYLAIVDHLGPNAMESASEFIGMAAHLVQMKSFLLLPKSEEAERLREELTGLLVEYSACKQVAGQLGEMAKGVYIAVRRPAEIELDTVYTGRHQVQELAAAYSIMMGRSTARRLPRQEQFDEIVAAPFVSVSSRVIHVLRGLKTGALCRLQQLFVRCTSRSETVATFLALLELIRGGRVRIDEQEQLQLQKNRAQRLPSPQEEGSTWS